MNTKQTSHQISKLLVAAMLLLLTICPAKAQDIEGGGTKAPAIGGISKAEKLYNDFSYFEAIPLYETYLQKHDTDAVAMAHLGDAYRNTSRYDKAEYWYSKAVTKDGVDPKYKLFYAQMLQTNGKYEDAAKYYAKYKEEVPEDRRAGNEMKASSDYGQFMLSRDRYTVKNLGFNSSGYDFSSAYTGDGLIYSSSRDSAKAISRLSTWTGTEFFDMWYVSGDKDAFGKPERLKGDAATKYHEGALSFTPDHKKVYFTRNNFYNGKTKTSSDKIIKLKIYESDVDGKTWKNDKSFAFNNDEYSVGHPALTADGNTMYFVSDMPGGYGMTDIYVTKKDSAGGDWGTPKNLGPEINTEGREMFPWVDSTGELYFASDAHGGLGGLDIFRARQSEKTGKWGKIKNIGAPINSSYDDFGLHYGKDKSYGYFTSNRPDGKGLDDIYTFTDDGINLIGVVVDAQTGEPICSSKVAMKTKLDQAERGRTVTECDGKFEFSVVKSMDYAFNASADGYSSNDSVTATTKGVAPGGTVYVKIPLKKLHPYAMQVQVLAKSLKTITDSAGMTVLDKRGLMPLANAKVLISSECEGWTRAYTTDDSGKICDVVRCDCDYMVVANAQGYLPGSVNAKRDDNLCIIDRKCGVNPREVEVVLDRIEATAVELKDIYYDFDKWYIRQESEPELTKLLGFMNENPDAIVEISSHTDARAPFDYNIRLSQRRAQSVVDWLIARGVDKKRLKAKGYGESQPRNGCTDGVPCTEYEHQRNRRTEFRVIGGSIDLKSLERFDMQVDPCKVCPF